MTLTWVLLNALSQLVINWIFEDGAGEGWRTRDGGSIWPGAGIEMASVMWVAGNLGVGREGEKQ